MTSDDQQWNIIETVLALDINFLDYFQGRSRAILVCLSTKIFGLTYPKILQTVVWDAVTDIVFSKSLVVLHRTHSPLLSTVRIPQLQLNNHLLTAAERGEAQSIPALISFGADINLQTPSYLYMPASKHIKPYGTPPESIRNMSALHLASMRGHTQVAELLAQRGADLRSIIPDKRTALDLAAHEGHRGVVRILVHGLLRARAAVKTALNADGTEKDSWLDGWDEERAVEMVMHLGTLMELEARPSLLHALVEDYMQEGVESSQTAGTRAELLVKLGVQLDADTHRRVTPLHYAAQQGCSELVRKYVELGANLERKAKLWTTPLHMAAFCAKYEAARALIELGADCYAETKGGHVALSLASKSGSVELVRLLLAKGAKVNHSNKNGVTPLVNAASAGHTEVVRVLVDAGADFEFGAMALSAINIAAFYGHAETVRVLIETGANASLPSRLGDTPLHSAVYGGHTETVRVLLDVGVAVDPLSSTQATPLSVAAHHGRTDIICLLIKAGADVNAKSKNEVPPLTQALSRGHVEAAKLLINHGADVALAERENVERRRVPLMYEPGATDYELTKTLVARGCKVPPGYLYHAVRMNKKDVVRALMEMGVNPNEGGDQGIPLHCAVYMGHTEVAEMLIKGRTEVKRRDTNEHTPLLRAVMGGQEEAVALLLRRGADVNTRTKEGTTALEIALYRSNMKLAHMLIDHRGADINVRMAENNTALHQAAIAGLGSVVRMLLSKGASTDATNDRGETPIHSAHRIRDILLKLGDARLPQIWEVINVLTEFNTTKPITADEKGEEIA